ncbi:YdeI/OmpD-associated family protein [Pedobacter punctiformis]|uniref:YdeI/OmpD-associated family protein n=1 Tax=Pedobacter punctiformis TaxID=3004097 RepID=A0ABT4LG14_9SPHI|nr:YdeI/OmpD-associated family protein [Pedobacter sp. HCMS5-2]MCZ4245759.1 YdeI/OmpD-associated family protein [Pedobacter sp. HCMS5-2]
MKLVKPEPFRAEIYIIGINPYVFIPEAYLNYLFKQAKKEKGKIPVIMKIDGHLFQQTLIKYAGHWRLYLNMPMRKAAGKDVGDTATFEMEFDSEVRKIEIHPKLMEALEENKRAKEIFEQLAPYLQKEIVRYIANLKTEESIERNVIKSIQFLLGKERFIGRDHP